MHVRCVWLLGRHPVGWGLAGLFIFWIWGGLIPGIDWNAIEMMMGRNLLLGNGLVVAPGDPPAIWRPVLGAGLCAVVEIFTSDPFRIYRILYTASLTTFLVCMFYAARALWGVLAAHVAAMLILTTGALTARLVGHPHSISHVAFLLVAGPAILSSILAMQRPTGARLFAVGLGWGLAYLARWETLLSFGVTLSILAWAMWSASRSLRGCVKCLPAVFGFALLFVPNAVYQKTAKARYGISGPSAISTFYASEGWVSGKVNEDDGFEQAVRIYGSMEANGSSVFRAIARNPGAVIARLRVNVPQFFGLFAQREFLDPLWLLLLAGLVTELAWLRKHHLPVIWLCLLFLSSASVCLFQIDSRYLIISLPGVLLLLCGGAQAFARRAMQWRLEWRTAGVFVCMGVFGWRMGHGAWRQFVAAEESPARQSGAAAVASPRELAEFFHAAAGASGPVVLTLDAKAVPSRIPALDDLLLSYFAGTGISWAEPGSYPRDKIFSWKPKASDYYLMPEGSLDATDLLLSGSPMGMHRVANGGTYYLFRAPEGKLKAPEGPASERMLAILTRDYPSLAPRFLEKTIATRLKPTLIFAGEAPHVGQADAAVPAGALAGHRDLLFRLTLQAEGDVSFGAGLRIHSVELRRQKATRIFGSSGEVPLLRVSSQEAGPPLHGTDGAVQVSISDKMELWLRICDDGLAAPDASYRCRVRIGDNGWIVTEPVSLH